MVKVAVSALPRELVPAVPRCLEGIWGSWQKSSTNWLASQRVRVHRSRPTSGRRIHSNSPDRDQPEKVSHAPPALPHQPPFLLRSSAVSLIKIKKDQGILTSYIVSAKPPFQAPLGSSSYWQTPVSKFVCCRALCQNFGM